jgi:hypothetical protein
MNSLMVALNMRAAMRRRWTVPVPSTRSFTVNLTTTPADWQSPISPTDLALKELRPNSQLISPVRTVRSLFLLMDLTLRLQV